MKKINVYLHMVIMKLIKKIQPSVILFVKSVLMNHITAQNAKAKIEILMIIAYAIWDFPIIKVKGIVMVFYIYIF